MPLNRCPRSGALFNDSDGPVHPDCMAEEEADYDKVLAYLRENPHAAPTEVTAALEIEPGVITRMAAQGIVKTLTEAEVEKQRKALSEKELHRLNAKLTEQIGSIQLPDKKSVEFGGTVRSLLQQKRKIE